MPYRYIYEIVNTANGHTYVGQRTSPCLPADDVYWGSGVLIKRASRKYGLSLFEKRILEVVLGDKRLLDAREKYWISERKAGGHAEYNISPGGTGGALLEGAPELKALAISRFKASYAARPVSARVATSAQISANVRRHWEKRMTAETHDKWHRRFRWIPNTPENAKTYNFEENVITGCYAQRNKK